jgi:hypothetical protein
MTESHFLPSKEDASMTDLALCGSNDSRSESLVARKAAWHRSRCERTAWLAASMSWSSRGARRESEASEAAANSRGAHVLKDKMPRPPSLIGRPIRALSTVSDGAEDAAGGSCAQSWPGMRPVVPRGVPSRFPLERDAPRSLSLASRSC